MGRPRKEGVGGRNRELLVGVPGGDLERDGDGEGLEGGAASGTGEGEAPAATPPTAARDGLQ